MVKLGKRGSVLNVNLYSGGLLIVRREKNDKDAGAVTWVEVYEHAGIECDFEGCVSFDGTSPYRTFLKRAKKISAVAPTLDRGSNATRKLGVTVGAVLVHLKGDPNPVKYHLLPDVLSACVIYDPQVVHSWDGIKEANEWEGLKIVKKLTAAEAAATTKRTKKDTKGEEGEDPIENEGEEEESGEE
jgi:hypothetical protein